MKHPDPSVDPEELAAHLEVCDTCAVRVRMAQVTEVPAWAREVEARRAGKLPFWKSTVLRFTAVALLGVVASLAVMAPALLPVLERGRLWASPLFARARGAPSVELWRQRGNERSLWDFSRCRAGDALELRVRPSVFRFLRVGLNQGDGWKTLLAQPVTPGVPATLPVALPLPAARPYTLAVLFGDEVIGAEALAGLPAEGEQILARTVKGQPYAVQVWVACGT